MIKIKSLFRGWQEVSAEQARTWALNIYNNAAALKADQKTQYINERIEGVTANELLNIENN